MKFRHNVIVLVALSLIVACAPKDLPPDLKPAYTANEVLIRVSELQKTVIALYDSVPRGISKERADLIVKFTIIAAETVDASTNGWQVTVKRAWIELNNQLEFTVPEKVQTIWKLVDAMIMAL